MSTLEAALRGGAVVILLFRAAVLIREVQINMVSRYSALLCVSIAAYIIDSAPGFDALGPLLRVPVHILNSGTIAVFWITMSAIFDDEFQLRWYHLLAWLALLVFGGLDMYRHPMWVDVTRSILSIAIMLLGVWYALRGRAADLIEGRRRLRIGYAIVFGLYVAVTMATDWLWPGGLSAAPFSLVNAVGLLGFIFLFAVLGTRLSAQPLALAPAQAAQTRSVSRDVPADPPPVGADTVQLAALRQLIDNDRVYREPDLSIASLSQKLDIPERRLRHLINEQLGHRNFNAFVNSYRLAEAKAALSDPAQAAVPILTIALDAGFGSIGPFNRAFKAQTGLTPTEYRRTRLNTGTEGSPNPH
jgi:AraC-like DNA-binding protein